MTNEQRHNARYLRRQAERQRRREERSVQVGGIEEVFTFHDLYLAGKKCCNGVRWKQSTQNFERHLFSTTARTRRKLLNKTWKPSKYKHFTLRERGKERPIDAPTIQDRQVHKVLANKVLLPLYAPDMIYNNGASLKGKGFHFSQRMLKKELCAHYRKYGMRGWVILLDYKKFFPTVPHTTIYARHAKLLLNDDIRHIVDLIVRSMGGDRGMPLGVETSQNEMIAAPSPVDNYIKCQLRIKNAGHYMDDYQILVPPDSDPYSILEGIIAKAASTGFTVNRDKTLIIPFGKPFKYCKAKYRIDPDTGKIIVNGSRASVKRDRRKIKALKRASENEGTDWEDIRTSVQGALAYFENYNDHNRLLRLRRLFFALFGFPAECTAIFRLKNSKDKIVKVKKKCTNT